ncbi:MAG: GxxExxY protein [Candidatus Ratteibacteria bacterium]|nr:GxxExxY protein [Candidatus Ratteibacteria bacterium]
MEDRDPLTERIIACCFKLHSELGPGFNEKIYHNALKLALKEANLEYQTEKQFTVFFQDKKIGSLKLDLIIEGKVIIEIKALTGNIPDVFKYQLLSYLKVSNLQVGLLVNFGNKSCQVKRFMF